MTDEKPQGGPPMFGHQDFKCEKPWQWEEDGMTVTRTTAWTAPGCHEGCDVLVYADKDGKLVKVEGDPESPFNRGRLCPRCFCVDEVMYNKDRIVHPMKRARDRRGDPDAWEQCSWDEALKITYDELRKVIDTYGADTIHVQRGTGRDAGWQMGRLAYALGSPNEYGALSGNSCYMPRLTTMIMTMGGQCLPDFSAHFADRYDNPQWRNPNCVMVWGCNPLNSNPDFQLGHWLTDCMKKGTKVVCVDPRTTWIAARAQVHLALRPGTDAALALAMDNVIITEDLYDHEFVEKWIYGFEDFSQMIQEWSPERVADICEVDADDIRAAARLYAEAKPSSVWWGLAVDMQKSGTGAAMAIAAMFSITGNVDIPGGMHFSRPPWGIAQVMFGGWGMKELLSEETQAKRCGIQKYPMYNFGMSYSQPDECLIAAEEGRVHAIIVQTTNTLVGMGDEVQRWYDVFKGLDFCLGVDLFMTPTLQQAADIFLPVACWPEKKGFRAWYYDVSTITPAVKPVGEVKSDCEIDRLIGSMFSKEAWPWDTEEEVYDEILKPSGFTWKELRDHGPAYPEYEYRKYEKGMLRFDGQIGFQTPSGRIELNSILFGQIGVPTMASFEEPIMSPVSTPDLYEDYPIILMTGARIPTFFHSEHRQVPRLRGFNPDPIVELNPATARKYGVKDGDWIWLENPRGKCRQRVKETLGIKEGMALGQHGWWFPEYTDDPKAMYGMWDVNINQLLRNNPAVTGFGSDQKCVLCRIRKVEEGEM